MASKTQTEEQAVDQPQRGVRLLTYDLIAGNLTVMVDRVNVAGRFGKTEVHTTIEGQEFILPLAPTNPQYAECVAVLGRPGEGWQGAMLSVTKSKQLRQVTVTPLRAGPKPQR